MDKRLSSTDQHFISLLRELDPKAQRLVHTLVKHLATVEDDLAAISMYTAASMPRKTRRHLRLVKKK